MKPPWLPLLALLGLLALTRSAFAEPGKVLVLPLDGDADPEIRAKYSASVQRLARTLEGKVTPGDATFYDTATAIGCDPKVPACAEDVRATLGVEQLVYGSVTKEGGKLVLVVRRVAKGKQRREVTTTLETSDSPARAEPALLPLFQEPTGEPVEEVQPPPPEEQPPETPVETPRPPLRRQKVIGYTAIAGGGALLLISFALWSSASGLEDDIAGYSVDDRGDFEALRELEDKASTRAWAGNGLFLAGLAVGGFGGWLLYRDHKAQQTVVAPAPVPGGAALMLRGAF